MICCKIITLQMYRSITSHAWVHWVATKYQTIRHSCQGEIRLLGRGSTDRPLCHERCVLQTGPDIGGCIPLVPLAASSRRASHLQRAPRGGWYHREVTTFLVCRPLDSESRQYCKKIIKKEKRTVLYAHILKADRLHSLKKSAFCPKTSNFMNK